MSGAVEMFFMILFAFQLSGASKEQKFSAGLSKLRQFHPEKKKIENFV